MSEEKRCIKCECTECKAKFDIWLANKDQSSETEQDPQTEEQIRKNISYLIFCLQQ